MGFLNDVIDERTAWNALALASATVAGMAVRNLLESGWQALREDEPPHNPVDSSVGWGDAVAWTVATGVAVGLGRLIAQRGAAEGWRKMRGSYPDELD